MRRPGVQIELHWHLFLNMHAMDEVSVMAASQVVPLTGTVELRTLGEEDLFTYLCVHGGLHLVVPAQMACRYWSPARY